MATALFATPTSVSPGDLASLASSWKRALRAQNKSPRTIRAYTDGVRLFDEYLARTGMPRVVAHVRREHVEAFIADQVDRFKPSTARTRFRDLQQFFKYLSEEGEVRASPMTHMIPPAIPETPPPVLTDDEVRRLLRAAEGKTFADLRDTAILRLLLDTGMRLAEITGLRIEDLDLDHAVAVVLGKGRRPRVCPFGPKAAHALDRYLRARGKRPMAARPALWLGRGGLPMTDSGIRQAITERAKIANIGGVHPHQFRHRFAHLWLAGGNQETDLMRLVGWRSRAMVGRYAASAADERAREAYRRAQVGEQI